MLLCPTLHYPSVFVPSSIWKVSFPVYVIISSSWFRFAAAGTAGPELLFQATSQQMIEAYSHVPRWVFACFSSLLSNSEIHTGRTERSLPMRYLAQACYSLSLSFFSILFCCTNVHAIDCSTDFRQFEYYLNVTGLDVRPSILSSSLVFRC